MRYWVVNAQCGGWCSRPCPTRTAGSPTRRVEGSPELSNYESPGFTDRTPAGVVNESTGFAGSPGIGTNPENLTALARVVVTTPGASSVPDQPMATVDAGDASIPSQVAEYVAGYHDPLVGSGPIGDTGITHGRPGDAFGGASA